MAIQSMCAVALLLLSCHCGAQSDKSQKSDTYRDFFPRELKKGMMEKWQTAEKSNRRSEVSFLTVEYKERKYWIVYWTTSGGQGAMDVAIYAPGESETHWRCLLAHTSRGLYLKARIDQKSGQLELIDKSNSDLLDQVILSCNLKAIGGPAE